jgi:hypothetical protein
MQLVGEDDAGFHDRAKDDLGWDVILPLLDYFVSCRLDDGD